MRITRERLEEIVVNSAPPLGQNLIERMRLIDAAERQVREMGAWEASDDEASNSVGPKSLGRASIDFAISNLKRQGRLDNPRRNHWCRNE